MPEAIIGRKLGPEPVNYGLGNGFPPGTSPAIVGWRCTQYDGIVASAAVRSFSAAGVF